MKTLKEVYDEVLENEQMINEGFFDRMKAKSGTRLASVGNKLLGTIQNVSGNSRLGQAAGQLKQNNAMDIEEKRAVALVKIAGEKFQKLYNDFINDSKKIGIDVNKLAVSSYKGTGKYPALTSLSKFLTSINSAITALNTIGTSNTIPSPVMTTTNNPKNTSKPTQKFTRPITTKIPPPPPPKPSTAQKIISGFKNLASGSSVKQSTSSPPPLPNSP